jgi:hypothetical protein
MPVFAEGSTNEYACPLRGDSAIHGCNGGQPKRSRRLLGFAA